ncbi:MAG: hypothetical protein AAGA54_19190 [Myxococcota bacterium]
MTRLRLALCVTLPLGGCQADCQAIKAQLGLEEGSTTDEPDAPSEDEPEDELRTKKKKGRRKKGKRKKAPPEPPPTDLETALGRAIQPPSKTNPAYRVDPFVVTLIADTLTRDAGAPFSRIKKDGATGRAAAMEVGALPKPSMWRRLGLRPGDLVRAVDRARPPGPKRLRALLKTLPREGSIEVVLLREGAERTHRYNLEPGLAWTRYLETEGGRDFTPPPEPKPKPAASFKPSTQPSNKPNGGGGSTKPAPVPVSCSGSTCTVPKWYFDQLTGSSSKARAQARGKSIGSGYKLTFVGPAARKAGFAAGEVITKINGKRTNNQLQMLSLYSRLKSTRTFKVVSSRGGKTRNTTILVK